MQEREQEGVVVRELLPEEFAPLASRSPFAEMGLATYNRDRVRVMGAIRGRTVVAVWMLYDAVHAEPLWVAEEERQNPAVLRPLWEGVRRILVDSGCPVAYAIVGDGGLPGSIPQAIRLGFQPTKGNLFYLLVADARDFRGERGEKE